MLMLLLIIWTFLFWCLGRKHGISQATTIWILWLMKDGWTDKDFIELQRRINYRKEQKQ